MEKTGILLLNQEYKINNKIYYKCFLETETYLIHYKKKLKFNKDSSKLYIIAKILDNKFAQLIETIGPVNELQNYERYLFHLYSLDQKTKITVKENKILEFTNYAFTIDGENTLLFDDAYSFSDNRITIYVSNFVDNINSMEHINYSNIYLGYKTINMLPDNVNGNLKEGTVRKVLALDIYDNNTTKLYNTYVKIYKNYKYSSESERLSEFKNIYNKIFLDNSEDFKKIVENLMIYFNKYCADILYKNKKGIFKTKLYTEKPGLHPIFNCYYVHITSPLRRLIDLYNMNQINLILEHESNKFVYLDNLIIDTLNSKIKKIRKIESRLYLYWNLLEEKCIHNGTIIEKLDTKNNEYNKYLVVINKTYHTFKTKDDYELNKEYTFKLYLFSNEVKQKIKLQIKN